MQSQNKSIENNYKNYIIALILRLCCYPIYETLSHRFEFKPFTSLVEIYRRMMDQIFINYLLKSPLLIPILLPFSTLPPIFRILFFATLDVLFAIILQNTFTINSIKRGYPVNFSYVYLFNPLAILNSICCSTSIFNNISVVLALNQAIKGNMIRSLFFIAFSTCLSLYPFTLVPFIVLIVLPIEKQKSKLEWVKFLSVFLIMVLTFLGLSYFVFNSFEFLPSSLGTILTVSDLTPNIGLFWYLLIEIFEHFRPFFLGVFQLHITFYILPLCIKFRDEPVFSFFVQLSVISIFKSYPSISDILLYTSLIPLFNYLYPYLIRPVLTPIVFGFCACLIPSFWHCWILVGSGNANFLYFLTLALTIAHISLVSDFTFALLKYKFFIMNPELKMKKLAFN